MSKSMDKLLEKFNRLIPDNDFDLIILKGHLLVEEILQDILELYSTNKKHLEDANLTFRQRLYICSAIVPFFHPHIFNSIELLNQLRNKLAHNLEPKDLNKKIDELIKLFEKDVFFVPEVKKEDRLKGTIACICGNLTLTKDKVEEIIRQ